MSYDIHGRRVPKLYLELGIIAIGAGVAGASVWFFDAWPYLLNWAWFIAGAFFGVIVMCLVVAFFMFGARGDSPTDDELERLEARKRQNPKSRLVQNGKPKSD